MFPWSFPLLKWRDTKGFVPVHGELPVCHEILSVDVDPDLDHSQLARGKVAGQNTAVVDRNGCLLALIANMNVWCMVLSLSP